MREENSFSNVLNPASPLAVSITKPAAHDNATYLGGPKIVLGSYPLLLTIYECHKEEVVRLNLSTRPTPSQRMMEWSSG